VRNTTIRLAVLATALVVVPALSAQPAESESDRESRRAALLERARGERAAWDAQRTQQDSSLTEAQRAARGLVSISFSGGPFSQFVDQLEMELEATQAPFDLNVLMQGGSAEIPIGPFELDQVDVSTAIQLATRMTLPGEPVRMSLDTLDNSGNPVFFVEAMRMDRRNPLAQPEVLVVSLKEITTALPGDPPEVVVSAETVLTAIETALAVAEGGGGDTRVQYHPESGLLVLAGGQRTLIAADQVIDAIGRDVMQRRDRARDLQRAQGLTNPDMLEDQLADARAEAELAEVRMHIAEQRFAIGREQAAEYEEQVEAGMVSSEELRVIRLHLAETEAEVQEQRIGVERSFQRVQQYEKALQRSVQIVSGGASGGGADALRAENDMLRERLAILEAQIAKLNDELKGRGRRGGGESGTR
jgi:cell division protein FtsB